MISNFSFLYYYAILNFSSKITFAFSVKNNFVLPNNRSFSYTYCVIDLTNYYVIYFGSTLT